VLGAGEELGVNMSTLHIGKFSMCACVLVTLLMCAQWRSCPCVLVCFRCAHVCLLHY